MNDILISICIPTYNSERYISECINSVLNQTYKNFEIIISDNSSNDNTLKIIESFNDPRIKIFKNKKNVGLGKNFNIACSYATGEFIKLLPSDDTISHDCLEKSLKPFSQHNDIALVIGAKTIVDSKSKVLIKKVSFLKQGMYESSHILKKTIKSGRNPLGEPGLALFKKKDFYKINGFDSSLELIIDLDCWLKLLNLGNLFYIDKPMGTFRIHQNSYSLNKKIINGYLVWINNLNSPYLKWYNKLVLNFKVRAINIIKQIIYRFLKYI